MRDTVTPDQIREYTLRDGDVTVSLLNLGCITRDWRVMTTDGPVGIVLGYDDPAAYVNNPYFLGAIVGRVANRIAGGRFTVDGHAYQVDVNEPPNTVHGGALGLGTRLWNVDTDGDRSLQFTYRSPHGENGFPGSVDFAITVELSGNRLTYTMTAMPDRPTPINLAQHSYYNLAGAGPITDHHLHLNADYITPVNAGGIPSGALMAVGATEFDLRHNPSLSNAEALDTNFVLSDTSGPNATLTAPSGLQLRMFTDQPGLQVYGARGLAPLHSPLDGQNHQPLGAICLEPQVHPDAINQPGFPNTIATPDAPYRQVLSIEIDQP